MKNIFLTLISFLFFISSCAQKQKQLVQVPAAETKPAPAITELKLSREDAFEKLRALSPDQHIKKESLLKQQEFSFALPTTKPEGDGKQEWVASYVTVFSKHPDAVEQVSIVTQNCNSPWDIPHQEEIKLRLLKQIKNVSENLWGSGFELNPDSYFKELGPHYKKSSWVPIRESYAAVARMRLSRGLYKCDGRSGYGYRYDFFM